MTDQQITLLLILLVFAVIAIRAYRRIRAGNIADHPTFETGRNESEWRRAYSRR